MEPPREYYLEKNSTKKGHIPSFQRTISTIFAIIHYLFSRRKILFLVIDGIFRA